MKPTSRMARVTKFRAACREAAMAPAKSMWLKMTPPKMVPRALVSRGSIVTRRVGSRVSVIDFADGGQFRRRPGKKSFIRRIELVARKALLHHFIAFVAGDR